MSVAIWERGGGGTNESERAYAQFRQYLELGEKRSIKAIYTANGTSKQATQELSQRHKWKERALAYDRHIARKELEAQMAANESNATIEDYGAFITKSLRDKLSRMETLIRRELARMEDETAAGKELDVLAAKRLLSLISESDSLARRSAKLPTSYRANAVEDTPDEEPAVFYVGGADARQREAENGQT